MSTPMSVDERVRQAALEANRAAIVLAAAMNDAHIKGVNFELNIQFNNGQWEIKLAPFTRAPIKLDN